MEALFLILGILLFIAWMIGLFIDRPDAWRKFIGNTDLKHRFKKDWPVRRS